MLLLQIDSIGMTFATEQIVLITTHYDNRWRMNGRNKCYTKHRFVRVYDIYFSKDKMSLNKI